MTPKIRFRSTQGHNFEWSFSQLITIQEHPRIVSVNLSSSKKRIVSSNIPDVRKLLPVVFRWIQMSCWYRKKISYESCWKAIRPEVFKKNKKALTSLRKLKFIAEWPKRWKGFFGSQKTSIQSLKSTLKSLKKSSETFEKNNFVRRPWKIYVVETFQLKTKHYENIFYSDFCTLVFMARLLLLLCFAFTPQCLTAAMLALQLLVL